MAQNRVQGVWSVRGPFLFFFCKTPSNLRRLASAVRAANHRSSTKEKHKVSLGEVEQ